MSHDRHAWQRRRSVLDCRLRGVRQSSNIGRSSRVAIPLRLLLPDTYPRLRAVVVTPYRRPAHRRHLPPASRGMSASALATSESVAEGCPVSALLSRDSPGSRHRCLLRAKRVRVGERTAVTGAPVTRTLRANKEIAVADHPATDQSGAHVRKVVGGPRLSGVADRSGRTAHPGRARGSGRDWSPGRTAPPDPR